MLKQFQLNYSLSSLPEEYGEYHTQKYGVLSLETMDTNSSTIPKLFTFMIDVSGSMSDIVSKGRSKIQLLKHTLQNMVLHFAHQTENMYIEIIGFDNNIHSYVDCICVSKENVNEIVSKIQSIHPMNSTDIGLAINTMNKHLNIPHDSIKNENKVGVLITDGEPTSGITNTTELIGLVENSHIYHFIALGQDHNARLMNALGKKTTKSCDWFIDDIEFTGNVYGEILFNETNRVLDDCVIHVNNGNIYNYKKGCFENTLAIGNLSSESKKDFHILTENMENVSITFTGINATSRETYHITSSKETPEVENNVSLLKQYYRLCVQKFLYDVRSDLHEKNERLRFRRDCFTIGIPPQRHNVDANNIKCAGDLKDNLQKFVKQYHLEDDEMLRGLVNDLSLIEEMNHQILDPFTSLSARENTQGRQLAFDSGSQTMDLNEGTLDPPGLTRTRTTAYTSPGRTQLMRDMSADVNDDISTVPYP